MALLGLLYHHVNTNKSIFLPINIMDKYKCALGYAKKSQDSYVSFIYDILPKYLTTSGIKDFKVNIESLV